LGSLFSARTMRTRRFSIAKRYRPAELRHAAAEESSPHFEKIANIVRATSEAETSAERLAEMVFGAIRENKFYVFPHPSSKVIMRERLGHIDQETNPEKHPRLMGVAN